MSGRRPTRKKWLRLDFLFFLVQILVLFRPTTFFWDEPDRPHDLGFLVFFQCPANSKNRLHLCVAHHNTTTSRRSSLAGSWLRAGGWFRELGALDRWAREVAVMSERACVFTRRAFFRRRTRALWSEVEGPLQTATFIACARTPTVLPIQLLHPCRLYVCRDIICLHFFPSAERHRRPPRRASTRGSVPSPVPLRLVDVH